MSATGHWNLLVKTPLGEQKINLELTEEAGVLTGTMEDDRNPVSPIQSPSVNGNQLSWKFPVTKPFAVTLAFTLQREGEKLSGTCKAGVFPAAPVTGWRAAP